jgi:hypothetical protein
MLYGNTAHNIDPQPLPEAALQAAVGSITQRGFPAEGILQNYSFSTNEAYPTSINALAFAHATRRNPGEYACFTIFNATGIQSDDEVLVPNLAKSTAPFHLIHRNQSFSFWASSVNNGKEYSKPIRTEISYEKLGDVLNDYSADLNPQRIVDVKQGRGTFTLPIFRDIYPLQLSLWVADVTGDLLVQQFANAVESFRQYARRSRDIRIYDEEITELSIQLLGAVILADTGVFGDTFRLGQVSLSNLIAEAEARFPRYFRQDFFEKHFVAAEEAYHILRMIRYASFVPDMLSRIYTAAYSKERRKILGRYDTPLYLTRRIWENIPVEYLPPEQRVVADMTCGWGSFLIAGHERLTNICDALPTIRDYLRGNDIDTFTSLLAGLALLLSTSEDSWYIDHEDALEWDWLQIHQPNIIVGNPPFGGDRKSLTGMQTRYQVADKFFKHAIERLAPGGYLAMIMPRSVTVAEASPQLREEFLTLCDVLEIWELPTEVFPGATTRTIVLFAQKSGGDQNHRNNSVRTRTVQTWTLKDFKTTGTFTASGLATNQSTWNKEARKSSHSENTHLMDYQIILPEYLWWRVKYPNLQEFAEIVPGAIVGQKPENKRWKDYPFPKQVPWLEGVRDVLPRPFFVDYTSATTIRYPNDLEEPRKNKKNPKKDKEYIFTGEKVLLVSDPDTTWGKRNKVAIERKGHYVSNHFFVLAPTAIAREMHITCEVLAAVLNWDISNAWIVEHLKSPAIPKRIVDTIPFPKNLSEDTCQALTDAVRELEQAALDNKPAPTKATEMIDTILKDAYNLDDATFSRIRMVTEWDSHPQITLDIQPDLDKADCFVSGFVENVDAKEGTITFDIKGFEEFQTVQIVPSMPGWLLRSSMAFYTRVPRTYVKQNHIDFTAVDWDTFHPQTYAYLSEIELMEDFANLFEAR